MDNLGDLLSAKREREGLSLRDASAASGIAFSTLSRLESGKAPSVSVYHRAMAWLNGAEPLLPTPPMTLRDWFAGQALAGILASDAGHGPIYQGNFEFVARASFEFADAMLAVRPKAAATPSIDLDRDARATDTQLVGRGE